MSSFHKSNLMKDFLSKLIPPKNDPKKEEESIKIDVINVEKNKPATNDFAPYPYKTIIRGSNILIFVAFVSWIMFNTCFETMERNDRFDRKGNIIPEKFLDPCNASDVLSFDEVRGIQLQVFGINTEMSSINTVTGYNISPLISEYLAPKLANLSTAATKLKLKLQVQKEIRFACFKENLEKRCEDKTRPPRYFYNSVYIYLVTCAILLTNSFYYISMAKKLDLTDEQLKALNFDYRTSQIVVIYHVLCAIIIPFSLFLNSECDIQKDLDKFPPYLFL